MELAAFGPGTSQSPTPSADIRLRRPGTRSTSGALPAAIPSWKVRYASDEKYKTDDESGQNRQSEGESEIFDLRCFASHAKQLPAQTENREQGGRRTTYSFLMERSAEKQTPLQIIHIP